MKFVLFIIIFSIGAGKTFGQDTVTVHLLKYGQQEGLPSYNVRKVIQDHKGFIWVGTQDGLSRFDGNHFLNFTKGAPLKNRICGVDVREIIEDSARNLLWILPTETGINAIDVNSAKVVRTIPIPKKNDEDWNISMLKLGNFLWIGTSTGVKIYDISANAYVSDPDLPRLPIMTTDFETRTITSDRFGNIWVCYSGYGIVVYNATTKKIIASIPLEQLKGRTGEFVRFFNCVGFEDQKILFATSKGLIQIAYTSTYVFQIDNHPCHFFSFLNTENVDLVTKTHDDKIIVAGYNKLFKFDKYLEKYELLEEPANAREPDWLNAVQYIFEDREKNIWLGCEEGVAFIRKDASPFTPYCYDKINHTKLDHVRSILAADSGIIYAGLRNGIAKITDNGHHYTKYDTGHLYHHIFFDPSKRLFVAREDGMFIFNNGELVPISKIYTEFSNYAFCPLNSHLFLNDSTIILGTENDHGILLWNPKRKTVRKIAKQSKDSLLFSSIVNNIFLDKSKNIWVLSDNVITVISPDLLQSKKLIPANPDTSLPYKLFFDMCEAGGFFWIASYGTGIIQLDSTGKTLGILNTSKGLSNDFVYQLYPISDGVIMITSNNGISVYNIHSKKFQQYFQEDGLHANSFEEVCGMSKDKIIYAGGLNGFTAINTKYLSPNTRKPLFYFTDVHIDNSENQIDTSDLRLRKIVIAPDALNTTVHFIALNYVNPKRCTYNYRIPEINEKWISLNSQNSVTLTGLLPGTYHLIVQAFNEDGVPSASKQLELVFLPKWYQTVWFKILIALVVAACIYTLYRIRINQFEKEKQIRSKLARDLHDDLGSTINSIKIFANLAIMEGNQDKHLLKIKSSTQEAISGIRDTIWVLDDTKDNIEHLLLRISSFAQPLCDANEIHYLEDISDQVNDYKLSKEEKRNLYMAIKEAMNNAIKYSGCKNIIIQILIHRKNPWIIIKDDGHGFEPNNNNEGNGLKNMKTRAKEIRFHFSIESSQKNGTIISFLKI